MTLTKLQAPRLREDVIPRQRLLAALHQAILSHPLTLISAPAGYGKTTLLAALLSASPDLPVAWLSLDEEDNDPIRFLAALIAALQRLDPRCGVTAQTLVTETLAPAGRADPGENLRRIAGVLINDILATLPDVFALVLEDLHRITEPAVYVALDYFLERLPPQMRLVVAARHDPPLALARLKARAQLAELRLGDLRFTPQETATWLQEHRRLGLSPEELSALEALTEGWAVGLRLLAISLRQLPGARDRASFLAQAARRDRSLFDFLAQEVLDHQAPAFKTFLLETSILPEPTASVCAAVTSLGDAGALLKEATRRNVLIEPVGESGEAFRYHPLFAEFLRRRLAQEMPQRVAELHRRAAEAETVPARAIFHYVAAQLWEPAAKLVEQVGEKSCQWPASLFSRVSTKRSRPQPGQTYSTSLKRRLSPRQRMAM